MKLIITEKPSTGAVMAHAVGAREKIFGNGGAFFFKGSGYYVVSARGHLYGIGEPSDYGFSPKYRLEELPRSQDIPHGQRYGEYTGTHHSTYAP